MFKYNINIEIYIYSLEKKINKRYILDITAFNLIELWQSG